MVTLCQCGALLVTSECSFARVGTHRGADARPQPVPLAGLHAFPVDTPEDVVLHARINKHSAPERSP